MANYIQGQPDAPEGSGTGDTNGTTQAAPAANATGTAPAAAAGGPNGTGNKPQKEPRQKKPLSRGFAFLIGLLGALLGVAAVFAVLLGLGVLGYGATSPSTSSDDSTSSSSAGQVINITTTDEDATTAEAVAAKALPSVVTITVSDSSGSEELGSGVILDEDGDIITNYHVVADAGNGDVTVTMNGNSYTGTVLGYDESSDLAVVKADFGGAEVTPIEVGDSDDLVVGDWVMTIGSPYGLDQSCSAGIVSSLYRSTMMQSTSGTMIYANLIQTDAAINPGNSGGALVNDKGQLVGISTLNATAGSDGSSASVGFAIPANYAINVADQIIAGKTVAHAYLGVSVQTVTANNYQSAGLSVSQGAYVARIVSGSPAEEAGLKEGDVVTAVDDEKISSADALILAVRAHDIGDKVTLTVVRGSDTIKVDVTLGSDEGMTDSSSTMSQQSAGNGGSWFGNGAEVSGSSSDGDYTYYAATGKLDVKAMHAA